MLRAFLTHEVLANIAETMLKHPDDYFAGAPHANVICYRRLGMGGAARPNCHCRASGRCYWREVEPAEHLPRLIGYES